MQNRSNGRACMRLSDTQYQIFEHAFELVKSFSELSLCWSLSAAELHICTSGKVSLTSNSLQINMISASLAQPHTCGNVESVCHNDH